MSSTDTMIRRLFYSSVRDCDEINGSDCYRTLAMEPSDRRWNSVRDEQWVIPLIVLCSVNVAAISCFEIFILAKTFYSRPSRRHLFLGQVLLLSLLSSSLLGFAFVMQPSETTCVVMRFGVGVCYATVFSSLLVKCVFLVSLNGGVYLPATYLGLLLFFAVAVQFVIDVQWLLLLPVAIVYRDASDVIDGGVATISMTRPPACNTGFDELVVSLVYVMFLLVAVGVLSIKSCRIRENYRESAYVGIAVFCTVVIWTAWMVLGLVKGRSYEDPCVAFGLVTIALVTFLIMFLPKGRQLAALGQEGLYIEDRVDDEAMNATPSVFAPSFYRFPPNFVTMWDVPDAICKNAISDYKCHKIPPGRLVHNHRPLYKSSGHNFISRTCNVTPQTIHNSMLY